MIYEIKEEYVGRCSECSRKYMCNAEDTQTFGMLEERFLVCPFCGNKIFVKLKEE